MTEPTPEPPVEEPIEEPVLEEPKYTLEEARIIIESSRCTRAGAHVLRQGTCFHAGGPGPDCAHCRGNGISVWCTVCGCHFACLMTPEEQVSW